MNLEGCRLVVGGVDLCERFGLYLTDESVTGPPPLKRYEVDVPGGDGTIDLTDALTGEPVYSNRECSFVLRSEVASPSEFERIKTGLSNLLHGRRLDYGLTADPGYTYTGRFEVDEYYSKMRSGCIRLKVTADPYKLKETVTYRVNAAGGVTVDLPCGRRRVCPTIEVGRSALVSMGGRTWRLEPGASRIRDLWLSGEANEVTVDTYPGYCVTYWTDYAEKTWADLAGKRWSAIGAGGRPLQESPAWTDYAGKTWAGLAGKRWVELMHPAAPGDEYAAYIQYDWEDL